MSTNRVAALGATAAFVIAVGVGLYFAGPPGEQRLSNLDQQRVRHLIQIKSSVDSYWLTHRALPARIDEDVIGIAMGWVPRDPETEAEYEYEVTGDEAYRLCAVFNRKTPQSMAGEFWAHGPGRQCFEFEVTEHEADNRTR